METSTGKVLPSLRRWVDWKTSKPSSITFRMRLAVSSGRSSASTSGTDLPISSSRE